MEQGVKSCNLCNYPCKRNIGTYVGKNAKVLFLFESPTYQADIENKITAGPVMQLFMQYLQNAGISVDDIAITYMVHCYTGSAAKDKEKLTNIAVKKSEYTNCKHYLDDVINQVKPKLIVSVGPRPTKFILGDVRVTLEDVYDTVVESPLYNIGVYSILNIYTLFIKPQYKPYGLKSFEFIKNFLDGKQRTLEPTNLTLVDDKVKLNQAVTEILRSDKAAIDIETNGKLFLKDDIMGIGFALDKENAYYIPLKVYDKDSDTCKNFWEEEVEENIKQDLKKFFSNNALKIAYNGQFDYKFIQKYLNIDRINNASFDVMLASHLLNENFKGMRTLKLLSVLYTDMGGYASILYSWLRKNKIDKKSMYKAPLEILGKYCMLDTIATFKLYNKFDVQLEREDLLYLFNTLTMPLQKTLMDVEYKGVQIDINHLNNIEKQNDKILEDKLTVIRGQIGEPNFNVNSTQQLAWLLFDKLKLKPLRITDSGAPATDKAVFNKYAKKNKVLQDILDFKKKRTENSTFVTGLRKELDSNNKVHTSYLLHGTDSGRLSSQKPNLQNISRDKNVKNLYIPEAGKVMIQCDLSQGEFNAWAACSQDSKMLNDIKNGLDIHRTVASKVWNLKPEDVTKELRTYAKRVCFGLMYGISIKGAADLVGCSEVEAQRIQDIFFGMYPKAAAWLRNIPVVAKSQGYLRTVFGRKRRFSHLFSHPLQSIRNYAERVAKNFTFQSIVADITARNMINLKPYLDSVGARIILTVHDSIIVQCDKDKAEEISKEMMKIVTQPVPNYHGIIKCDIEVGTSWGHLDKVEFDAAFDNIINEDIFDSFDELSA
jgi:DNA polymerase-1